MHFLLCAMGQNLGVVRANLSKYLMDSVDYFEFDDHTWEVIENFGEDDDGFGTIEEYASYHGYVEQEGRFGIFYNPNVEFDGFQFGGCFQKFLLVREDVTDYFLSEDAKPRERPISPVGYRWVDGARKKDIQWNVMKENGVDFSPYAFLGSDGEWTDVYPKQIDSLWGFLEEEEDCSFFFIVDCHA